MKKVKKLFGRTAAVLTVGCLAFTGLIGANSLSVSAATVGANGNYYYADYDTKDEALQEGDNLNKEIIAEGTVLLKNENSLPLRKGAKVSVFGKRSVNLIYGGQGSGSGGGGAKLSMQESLARAGIEANPALTEFYKDTSKSGTFGGVLASYRVNAGLAIKETPRSSYTSDLESTYSEYGDAAIIVISRFGGEAVDLPKSMATGFNSDGSLNGTPVDGARSYTDHYLQPDQNETDLIKYVGERFDNVIIVFNTPSQYEAGFLDDPGHYAYHENIKGALWIGYPGTKNGFESFGKILTGEINPSGKTVDTYARDFTQDPTYCNLLTQNNQAHKYTNNKANYGFTFIDYEEGIYVGYRYYETRGMTEGSKAFSGNMTGTTTTQWDNWYDANVIYPFGYGLSYTSFKWEFVDSSPEAGTTLTSDGKISMSVRVTNTGSVAGKDVVQMYYTAPYTPGEIEKSHVVLGDFAKTRLLEPGESQVLTLTMSVQSMASYDYNDANRNDFKGYELDGGTYTVKLMRNSHESVIEKNFTVPSDGYEYRNDEKTGAEVVNRFDEVSSKITTYLSRNNWEGTFPQAPTEADRVMTDAIYQQTIVDDYRTDDPSDPWYTDTMPNQKAGNVDGGEIMWEDLIGLDYDDPKWDEYMDQFTVGDKNAKNGLARVLIEGDCNVEVIEAMGIPKMYLYDGPSGVYDRGGDHNMKIGDNTNFANEVCVASTWNKELAYRKGLIMGNEALFGGVYNDVDRVTGLYAPAVNLHRSPFGGRNYEYFSEDGVLSGKMAAEIIKGCNQKGLLTFLKHFAVNESETSRDLLHTWVNEQAMRELYFKPFEICVKEGETHGMMSSLNFIGGTWAGGSYELLTEVLRGEWQFEGVIITDFITTRPQLNYDQCIRAGGDLMLTKPDASRNFTGYDKPTQVACMRQSVKNALFYLGKYSMALNKSAECIMGAFTGGQLNPSPVYGEFTQSVATVKLNDGGDVSDIKYSLKSGSELPQGLTLNEDGSITGLPTQKVNNYKFTVVAEYLSAKKEAEFTLNITDPNGSIIYSHEDGLLPAYIGKEYSCNVGTAITSVANGEFEITYSLGDTSILPEGLSLSADGVISGVPTKKCSGYAFEVVASAEGFKDVSQVFEISVFEEMQFATKTLKAGKFGHSYNENIATAGGGASYALKEGSALPKGLTLTAGGNIVGKPSEVVKDYSFTVVASIVGYEDKECVFIISIGINYPEFTLEDTQVGDEYEAYVQFAQGVGEAEYTLKEGSALPKGLELSKDGRIYGVVEQAGDFEITLVANADGVVGDEVTVRLFVDGIVENKVNTLAVGLGIGCGAVALAAAVAVAIVVIRKKRKN